MTIEYDSKTDELVFSDGKREYCFGGNPSIAPGNHETLNYSYGSDGGFSVEDIGVNNAIEMAELMIKTWAQHKKFLEQY